MLDAKLIICYDQTAKYARYYTHEDSRYKEFNFSKYSDLTKSLLPSSCKDGQASHSPVLSHHEWIDESFHQKAKVIRRDFSKEPKEDRPADWVFAVKVARDLCVILFGLAIFVSQF
uniref:Uncharacterized protein n=1 Tax=Euplotes harpa TaxID=151035 RepID=A0A7S3J1H8_9SPIT|mmetsp:Transcript_14340/g.16577  ORF Transcript_14340/g.16577 Transcript_14340/m.16577 type:complete len:116 (+) Transcript_14340:1189-1536(+)